MSRIRCYEAAALGLSLCLSAAAFAADLPPLRKGMWEFVRTVDGQGAGGKPVTLTRKACTDPSADMKRNNEMLAKSACKFSAPSSKGNVYTFSAECPMQGVAVQSQSVLTFQSDSSYSAQITSSGGGKSTKELLVAKRLGDC